LLERKIGGKKSKIDAFLLMVTVRREWLCQSTPAAGTLHRNSIGSISDSFPLHPYT